MDAGTGANPTPAAAGDVEAIAPAPPPDRGGFAARWPGLAIDLRPRSVGEPTVWTVTDRGELLDAGAELPAGRPWAVTSMYGLAPRPDPELVAGFDVRGEPIIDLVPRSWPRWGILVDVPDPGAIRRAAGRPARQRPRTKPFDLAREFWRGALSRRDVEDQAAAADRAPDVAPGWSWAELFGGLADVGRLPADAIITRGVLSPDGRKLQLVFRSLTGPRDSGSARPPDEPGPRFLGALWDDPHP